MPIEFRRVEGLVDLKMLADRCGLRYATAYRRVRVGTMPGPTHTINGSVRRWYTEPEAVELIRIYGVKEEMR